MNCSGAKNFTARTVISGHTQFADATGNLIVNYLELGKMIPSNRDKSNSFLNNELKKPSWTVDGVGVHEIRFLFYDDMYSAYLKNSSKDTIIWISTTNEQERRI